MELQWLDKILVEIYKVQTTKKTDAVNIDDLLSNLSQEFNREMLNTLVDELSNQKLVSKNNNILENFYITELGKLKIKALL